MLLVQQILFILSYFVDAYCVVEIYKLVTKKKNVSKNFIVLSVIVDILPFLSIFINDFFIYFFSFIKPLFFYLYFVYHSKYEKYLAVFLSLFLVNAIDNTITFLDVFTSSITGDQLYHEYQGFISFLLSLLAMKFLPSVIKFFKFEFSYFRNKDFSPLVRRMIFVYLTIYLILRLSDHVSLISHFNSTASMMATITFLAFIFSLGFLRSFREDYEKKEAIKQKIREQELFQKYTDEIVELYNEIRGFRHDYAGMLVSLQSSIDSGEMSKVQKIYDEVLLEANLSLRSDKYTTFDLNNIKNPAFRSVLTEAMLRAKEADLDVTFEMKEIITEEFTHLPLLDLVRVTSILLNNAVEAAAESYEKKVHISLINMEKSVIFVIQNSRKKIPLKLHQLFERGYSTKGFNRGLGLSQVSEILDEYRENLMLDTEVTEDTFTQVLTFHE